MMTLMYFSRIPSSSRSGLIPEEFSNIIYGCRRANRTHGITGMISFRKGCYIQIIEGEEASVQQLYANICKDPRHQNPQVLVQRSVRSRSFPEFSLRRIINSDDYALNEYLNTHCFGSTLISTKVKRTVCLLFNLDFDRVLSRPSVVARLKKEQEQKQGKNKELPKSSGSNNSVSEPAPDFNASTRISMTGWPDFNRFAPTKPCISLCVMLVNSEKTYAYVLKSHEYPDQRQLDDELKALKKTGLLRVEHQLDSKQDIRFTAASRAPTEDSFYAKMKSFLHIGHRSNAL